MDHSVQLLSIERPKQHPSRPVHFSQTKLTRNPNSPVKPQHDGRSSKDLQLASDAPKGNLEMAVKNGHTDNVCKKYHKNEAEYDERKHVYKTDHNTFEITVKLKKPHSARGASDKLIQTVEVTDGTTTKHQRQDKAIKQKHKNIREGTWADVLSKKNRHVEADEEIEVIRDQREPEKKAPRSRSESGQRQRREREEDVEFHAIKYDRRNKNKEEVQDLQKKRKNKTVFTITKAGLRKPESEEVSEVDEESEAQSDAEAAYEHPPRYIRRTPPVQKKKPSQRESALNQLLLEQMEQLKEENRIQKEQISDLTTQLDRAQSELREYMDTIRELYDLATVLKNENQNLLDNREQIAGEKLATAIAENELLKKHLQQLTQQHELILKPKDVELKKLKSIVTDVKATLEQEINDLQSASAPITTSVSSTAAAKCSSSSFFRNLNLTDEERDNEDRRSESLKTSSISEIPTIDDDEEEPVHIAPKTKTTNLRNRNQNPTKWNNNARELRERELARVRQDEYPSIDDDSSSTQYLYLQTSDKDKNRDLEKDEDLDGLRK